MSAIREAVRKLRPRVLTGVLPLHRKQLPTEIVAGVTLAALAIPEVMGYAKIAGTPVITGLYTLLIPAALFAVFGSSRHLAVGADSATAAILASGLAGMAVVGAGEYLAFASLLAVMVGVLLLLASVIGLGFMADFLSRTVLVGFLSGVGVQVAGGALVELLGVQVKHPGSLMTFWSDWDVSFDPNVAALVMAAAVLAVITASSLCSRILKRRIPGPMIAVVGAIIASWAFDLGEHMPVVGSVPVGLPEFALPDVDWSLSLIWQLFPTAFAMVVVVLAQSAATSRAYAARYNETLDEEQDLIGLGLANVGAGLSGTFVVNGSPTKTEMANSAGGRSQLCLLAAAVIVLMTLLFLTGPLGFLPDAVLSTVVILIGLKLIDVKGLKDIFRQRRWEFWVALSTAAVVVALGVEQGIIFAILFSLIVHTRHGYRPKNYLLVRQPSGRLRAEDLDTGAQVRPGLLIYRFGHSMYYANSERMKDEVYGLVAQAKPPLRWLCIDVTAVDDVDYTSMGALSDIKARLQKESIKLVFAQNIDDLNFKSRKQIRSGFKDAPFFESLGEVLDQYERQSPAHTGEDR